MRGTNTIIKIKTIGQDLKREGIQKLIKPSRNPLVTIITMNDTVDEVTNDIINAKSTLCVILLIFNFLIPMTS